MTNLTGNIPYGKLDVGVAEQIQGYRTFDTDAMMCPLWTGTDLAGRPACQDSFYTKRAGCNSALDRIKVEDALRPRYAEFLLDARGIVGAGADYDDSSYVRDRLVRDGAFERKVRNTITGNFGNVTPSEYTFTSNYQYDVEASNGFQAQDAMAAAAQNRRNAQRLTQTRRNPNTTDMNPMWRNDMYVPLKETTIRNYIHMNEYGHYSGEHI